MNTLAKVAIGVGAGVGAYLVYKKITEPKVVPRPQVPSTSTAGGFLNFATSLVTYFGTTHPQNPVVPGTSAVPVYEIGEGYTQGGANAPISPSTGGVYLPPGEEYGPFI